MIDPMAASLDKYKAFIQSHPGLHGKSAILAATGIAEAHWNAAIKGLVEEGKEKKEARYGV